MLCSAPIPFGVLPLPVVTESYQKKKKKKGKQKQSGIYQKIVAFMPTGGSKGPPSVISNMGGGLQLLASLSTRVVCLLLLLLLHAPSVYSQQNQSCNSNDLDALRGFSNGLNSSIPGWGLNGSCCDWPGVLCDTPMASGRRVVGLDLGNKNLKGSVSGSLAGLDQLQSLNLSVNYLQGLIPPKLFQLPLLQILDVSSNKLAGTIPKNLSLPAIRVFNISSNQFIGSHPILAGSSNLTSFDIGDNKFYGPIDAGICGPPNQIQVLRFAMNDFSGKFPRGLKNCSYLVELSLGLNRIGGDLPDELFQLRNLRQLFLQDNLFSGNLSANIANLSKLVQIDLSMNRFSGFIPDVFNGITQLKSLTAQANNFSGNLPASLSSSPSLRVLNLNNNSLHGEIRINCTLMVQLETLDLGSNKFSGPVPSYLPQCSQLKTLNLAKNNLTGEIPDSFRNFTSLSDLSLTGNFFSNITSALQIIQHIPTLTSLVLTRNFQNDEAMPQEGIDGFQRLQLLVIANCALSGPIPPWLAHLSQLKVLDISWNLLHGTIPSWFGDLENLFYLDLSNNSLSGTLPNELTQMKSLVSINTSSQASSTPKVPFFVTRNETGKGLQYNQVTSFPASLVLSHNMLVGSILPGFGNLINLQVLDLSWNNLSGTIPEQLSDMSNLLTLVLSHNNLTGHIPSSLTKLNFLSNFDVSYNNLTGSVPTGGQFFSFSNSDFEGNPGLCVNSSACPSEVSSKAISRRNNRHMALAVALGTGAGAALLLSFIYLFVSRTRARRLEDDAKVVAHVDESFESGECRLVVLFRDKDDKELSIQEIIEATNNFDQAHIIGCGGFGLVYKATLADGGTVAIKRLSGDYLQMEREFQAEVETLSRAQHTNLVPLQGHCKLGSDRLLIYKYMENGSLDYWLHEKVDGGLKLDWEIRLHIAQGAARGLAYLHQSCNPHILHRDIKSSNILLDENFKAHLADFGLARLILPYDTHVTTDLVGTLGYIPPEYGQSSVATFKGDVYSFGIVLLELLTGRRPVDMCRPKASRDVVSWVLQMKREKREAEVFDPIIHDKEHNNELMRMLEIACVCVSHSPKLRPLSNQLVAWLEEIDHKGQTTT